MVGLVLADDARVSWNTYAKTSGTTVQTNWDDDYKVTKYPPVKLVAIVYTGATVLALGSGVYLTLAGAEERDNELNETR